MNQHQRRATAFMAIGLAAAVAVGVVVWNLSSPDRSVTAGYTSAETGTSEPGSQAGSASARSQVSTSSSRRDGAKAPRRFGKTDDDALAGQPADAAVFAIDDEAGLREPPAEVNPDYRMDADPFAPPLAVTNVPQSVAPTTAYRPTNVQPATVDSSPPPPSPTGEDSANRPNTDDRSETSPPVRTTPAPSEPSAPNGASAESVAPNRPDQNEGPAVRPLGTPMVERGGVPPDTPEQSDSRTPATVTPLRTTPAPQPSPREQVSRAS